MGPIPAKIMTHTVELLMPGEVDVWGKTTPRKITVSRVCVQPTNATIKSQQNTEVVLRSICFIDRRVSRPADLNVQALRDEAEAAGGQLQLVYAGKTYTVQSVDVLVNSAGAYHHTEVGLV